MIASQLDVRLHGFLVGTITNIVGDVNVFTFDDAYREDETAPVLSFKAFRDPMGAYRERIRPTRTRLHPYFANLLPEGRLRTYLADRARVKLVRDFPLLWILGRDLPGALIVEDREKRSEPPEDREHRGESSGSKDADALRFSLAGVQLKFSAGGDPVRGLTIPVEGMGGSWIVKMPDQRYRRVPENEFSMMTFAKAVGIDVPDIGLVDLDAIGGLPEDMRRLAGQAYYIRRFDRTANGGRVHTEDFAQANLIYPHDKYRAFNFDMLAEQIVRQTGVAGGLDFIRRLVFTVGIGNGDMHAKNWSFIYRDGRTAAPAPAYDYVSTILYMPDDLGMNLLGSKAFADVDESRLKALAARAGLPTKPTLDAARDMVERMRETWPKIASDLPLDVEDRRLVERHMNGIPIFGASSRR